MSGGHGAPPERQIAAVASRARYTGPNGYVWDGREAPLASAPGDGDDGYPRIVDALTRRMYDRGYTRADVEVGGLAADPLLRDAFVARLHAANATEWSWVPGWRVVKKGENALTVENDAGDVAQVAPDAFEFAEGGEAGRVRLEKGSATIQPGWYYVRGERGHVPGKTDEETVRVYWNACAAGAAPLVQSLSKHLNRAGVPFRFKVVSDPSGFQRADTAVLYLPKSAWREASRPVARVHEALLPYLRALTPLFTKRLGHGIAVAEDPGDGESFGMHRCRLIAQGLWDAHAEGATDDAGRLDAVHARFESAGVRPSAPHLQGGKTDEYAVDARAPALPI